MLDPSDTIVAIAGRPGPATRGLVRLSGPDALAVALDRFEGEGPTPIPTRPTSVAGALRLDGLTTPLPATLILWPGPRSYTGEAVAEVHTVGSPPLLGLVVAHALARGARPAEPGEFTLRAFLSGRLDLSQAEAVLSVIEAKNPEALELALRRLAGGLSTAIRALRDRLLDRLVEVEAALDFVDEADVAPVHRASLIADLDEALTRLETLIAGRSSRDRADARPRVVLVGPPNAGKSRLFNALAGRGRAIVSPVAGTTRDYLIAPADFDGLALDLIDTAGEEAPDSPISSDAQGFRIEQAGAADLVLRCDPAGTPVGPPDDPRVLLVATKADLDPSPPTTGPIRTSAETGEGLAALRSAVADALRDRAGDSADGGLGPLCRESLDRSADALRSALAVATGPGGDELIAADLRAAIDDLGKVVGAVVTEDILDRIFRRFCIGK